VAVPRWLGSVVGCVALLASACTAAAPPPPPSPSLPPATPTSAPSAMRFRVVTNVAPVVAPQMLPYWVGMEAGLFQQQGLALELATVASDQLALTAAANGEIDVVLATPAPPLLAVLAGGLDAIVLGGTHNAFDLRLLAAADVTEPAGLVGKTAVINHKGTLNDFQTREALARVGLDPETDLAGYWVGANQAERVNNLRLGNGQTTVLPLPLSATLVREGFVDFGDLSQGPPWPGVAIITSRRVYTARFDYLQRFLKGLLAGIQRTKADPALARKVLATQTKIDDPEAVEEAYAMYGDRLLERVPYLSTEGLQRAIDFAATGRPAVGRLRPSTLVDHSVLQRLEGSGYVDELYR
jgi:ABC-type nitrate/sulfonate/bicarbonate transport system substrate-binding protein